MIPSVAGMQNLRGTLEKEKPIFKTKIGFFYKKIFLSLALDQRRRLDVGPCLTVSHTPSLRRRTIENLTHVGVVDRQFWHMLPNATQYLDGLTIEFFVSPTAVVARVSYVLRLCHGLQIFERVVRRVDPVFVIGLPTLIKQIERRIEAREHKARDPKLARLVVDHERDAVVWSRVFIGSRSINKRALQLAAFHIPDPPSTARVIVERQRHRRRRPDLTGVARRVR